jgi:hypothetical protein
MDRDGLEMEGAETLSGSAFEKGFWTRAVNILSFEKNSREKRS